MVWDPTDPLTDRPLTKDPMDKRKKRKERKDERMGTVLSWERQEENGKNNYERIIIIRSWTGGFWGITCCKGS